MMKIGMITMTAKTINFRDLPPDERKELIAALESEVATLRRVAGHRIEDLCESTQDAVREVIRVCREHGRCRREIGRASCRERV